MMFGFCNFSALKSKSNSEKDILVIVFLHHYQGGYLLIHRICSVHLKFGRAAGSSLP